MADANDKCPLTLILLLAAAGSKYFTKEVSLQKRELRHITT